MRILRHLLCLVLAASSFYVHSGEISLISHAELDLGGDADSGAPTLSADGRYVAFVSAAGNLATNTGILKQPVTDVYLHDRQSGATRWITISTNGNTGADNHCWNPQLSADGTRILFESSASNLHRTATNGTASVMVFDLAAGSFLHASVSTNGTNASAPARNAQLSANGNTVAFESAALNLTAGIIYQAQAALPTHIFARDLEAGKTEIVDVDFRNREAGRSYAQPYSASLLAVSSNGSIVAFLSNATNLLEGYPQNFRSNQLWIRDLTIGSNILVSSISDVPSLRAITAASMNADGTKFLFFNGGTLFRDLAQPNSVPTKVPTNAVAVTISPDGELVAFTSRTERIVYIGHVTDEIFVPLNRGDFSFGETNLIFSADSGTLLVPTRSDDTFEQVVTAGGRPVKIKYVPTISPPAVSADGSIIAFDLWPTTNRYENVFVEANGSNTLISKGTSANAAPHQPTQGPKDVSVDGRFTLFTSFAAMAQDDTNGFQDVYFWDSVLKTNIPVSRPAGVSESGNSASFMPHMTPDGEHVVFASAATNLIENDTNRMTDIFVWRRGDGSIRLASQKEEGTGNLIQPAVLACSWPVISKDARYAAFVSRRIDLVPGSRRIDGIYVRDLLNEQTFAAYPTNTQGIQWSRTVAVLEGPVVYYFERTNLLSFNVTNSLLINYSNCLSNPSFSADDQRMAVISRTAGVTALWVYETSTGQRQQIYRYPSPTLPSFEHSVSISGDGKRVAFVTWEALLEDDTNRTNDVYVAEIDPPHRLWLAKPDAARAALAVKSLYPSLSSDGRRVSFVSKPAEYWSRTLPIESSVYLVDLPLRKAEAVSRTASSNPYFGSGYSAPLLLRDGSGVVFGTQNAVADSDGNRISDLYFATFSLQPMVDTDSDEMPDEWEIAQFGNLAQTADGDEDHDGWTNLQEFLAGTDPTDGNSILRLEVMESANGGLELRWEAMAGLQYEVQFKLNVEDSWQVLSEESSPTGGIVELTIDPSQERGFYRIRLKQ